MRILPSSFLLAILFAYPAVAQAVDGNVYGTTTDQSGALIAGARITVLDVAKGTVVQTASNASGNYWAQQRSPFKSEHPPVLYRARLFLPDESVARYPAFS
jgi:hypothetical protein